MDIQTVALHPNFPQQVWIVIEQPRHAPYRYNYDPVTNAFTETAYKSLFYDRGFRGAYGWIGGIGAPPDPHFDVLLLTDQRLQPGDIVPGYICGIFLRSDGDHKFVALDSAWRNRVTQADLAELDANTNTELRRLYPYIGEHEGWFGAATAQAYLQHNQPSHE